MSGLTGISELGYFPNDLTFPEEYASHEGVRDVD